MDPGIKKVKKQVLFKVLIIRSLIDNFKLVNYCSTNNTIIGLLLRAYLTDKVYCPESFEFFGRNRLNINSQFLDLVKLYYHP